MSVVCFYVFYIILDIMILYLKGLNMDDINFVMLVINILFVKIFY